MLAFPAPHYSSLPQVPGPALCWPPPSLPSPCSGSYHPSPPRLFFVYWLWLCSPENTKGCSPLLGYFSFSFAVTWNIWRVEIACKVITFSRWLPPQVPGICPCNLRPPGCCIQPRSPQTFHMEGLASPLAVRALGIPLPCLPHSAKLLPSLSASTPCI